MSLAYFTVPKLLDTDARYATLSIEAKYLYAHLRDRLKLSVKNRWEDPLGYYVKMSRTNMAELLHRSKPYVRKIIGQLKAAGLIVDIRMGLTKCNRIYVQLLPGESIEDFRPKAKTISLSKEKPGCSFEEKGDFTPEGNAVAPSKPNPSYRKLNNNKKKDWKWFIQEGTKWFDADGKIWQFIDGEIAPYLMGEAYLEAVDALLAQVGLG